MYLLETLGRIRLTDAAGRDVDHLLRQPKRLALLAYLAAPHPGTWHRREVLLGVFWPELDAAHARTALRNALHVLRQHAGVGVIRTRGDDDVSVDPALFATDASDMEHDASAGRASEAFARYRGEYLRGLYIKEAGTFERWLDDERRRLLASARKTGLAAVDACDQSGDLEAAVELIERVTELDPHDESVVRRLIALLDRCGDHARALAAYERFRSRLGDEFSAEPAAETVAQVEAIRARRVANSVLRSSAPALLSEAPASIDKRPVSTQHISRRWTARRLMFAAGIVIAAVSALVAFRGDGKRLIILPPETGASDSLAYLGSWIGDQVGRELRGVGGLRTVRSGAYGQWPRAIRGDLPRVGRAFGATVALRTTLSAVGDSILLAAELVDIGTKTTFPLDRYAFFVADARDVSSRLAAAVAGKLFRAALPQAPHADPRRLVNSESFRLAIDGWYRKLNTNDAAAESLFRAAIDLDRTNARAWAGLSSVYSVAALTSNEEWNSAAKQAEEAGWRAMELDSLEGTPLANIAILRALKSRRLSDAESLFARAIALDPANPELYVIKATVYRHAWQWDKARDALRFARELDPFAPGLIDRAATLELCAGRPREALVLNRAALALDAASSDRHRQAARIFARLGQWDDALAELRLADPTQPAELSSDGSAEAAYWKSIERVGRTELARREKQAREGWLPPVMLGISRIYAGDLDGGMSLLENGVGSGTPSLYRLPCLPQVDRVRGTPRFKAILAAIPKWQQ